MIQRQNIKILPAFTHLLVWTQDKKFLVVPFCSFHCSIVRLFNKYLLKQQKFESLLYHACIKRARKTNQKKCSMVLHISVRKPMINKSSFMEKKKINLKVQTLHSEPTQCSHGNKTSVLDPDQHTSNKISLTYLNINK